MHWIRRRRLEGFIAENSYFIERLLSHPTIQNFVILGPEDKARFSLLRARATISWRYALELEADMLGAQDKLAPSVPSSSSLPAKT